MEENGVLGQAMREGPRAVSFPAQDAAALPEHTLPPVWGGGGAVPEVSETSLSGPRNVDQSLEKG